MAGRPSIYTQELADEICRRLADGETLRAICRDDHMPGDRTVREWALDNLNGFSTQYERARLIGYFGMADDIVEIADDGSNDTYKDEHGAYKVDQEAISRSRLRVDTRKWLLSKALPKIFGDKLTADINATVKDETESSPLELARKVAFLLTAGVQQPEEPKPLH
jgi:hypothetical protein